MAILGSLDSLLEAIWDWLANPSIIPWVGAVAAVVAALSIDTRTWLKSPLTALKRAICVVLIWMLAAWLVNAVCQKCGYGRGGSDSGTETGGSAPRPGQTLQAGEGDGTSGDLPSDLRDKNVIVVVKFVPLPDDKKIAQDFACDLFQPSKGDGQHTAIRASDMSEFDILLVRKLRKLDLPLDVGRPRAIIHRSPFPGEGTLRRVKQKLQIVMPSISIEFDK